MLADSDPSKDSASRPDAAQPNPKFLDLENPSPRSSLFGGDGGDGGGGKTGTSSTAAPQELTLSYLCENPKPGLQEKDGLGSDLFVSIEKARAKGKEIALDPLDDDRERWVERDFLGGGKAPAKREGPEGMEGEGQEKKVKIETLNLSLGPPNLSLSLHLANPAAPPATVSAAAAPAAPSSAAAPVMVAAPAKRSFSNNTRATNSNDYGASLSYSCSAAFSHNPSCSLTRNSTENFDVSRENDTMWYAGEGTNGSVHSRFKPVGDSITFSNLGGFPHVQGESKEAGNSLCRANSSENISFFPAELPARAVKANAGGSSDTGKGGMMLTRLLKEIASESVPHMVQILQDFPTESLEAVKESLRNLMNTPEKRDEFSLESGWPDWAWAGLGPGFGPGSGRFFIKNFGPKPSPKPEKFFGPGSGRGKAMPGPVPSLPVLHYPPPPLVAAFSLPPSLSSLRRCEELPRAKNNNKKKECSPHRILPAHLADPPPILRSPIRPHLLRPRDLLVALLLR